jgi:hypothetical protein
MLRLILILTIIFLIARAFIIYGQESSQEKPAPAPGKNNMKSKKGVPKELGEYIDYEEIGKSQT